MQDELLELIEGCVRYNLCRCCPVSSCRNCTDVFTRPGAGEEWSLQDKQGCMLPSTAAGHCQACENICPCWVNVVSH